MFDVREGRSLAEGLRQGVYSHAVYDSAAAMLDAALDVIQDTQWLMDEDCHMQTHHPETFVPPCGHCVICEARAALSKWTITEPLEG